MKQIVVVIIISILSFPTFSQDKIYLDTTGQEINWEKYRAKWGADSLNSTWSYFKNDTQYFQLSKNLYLKGLFDYNQIRNKLEVITPHKIPLNWSIVIEYRYKDDLCTNNRDNIWDSTEITDRKMFLNDIQELLNENEIYFIVLFEEGIKLKNRKSFKSEYFFNDPDNFFKNKLQLTPTLCGTFIAINPKGETLIRNGEYRADQMADHLLPVNWSQFFHD